MTNNSLIPEKIAEYNVYSRGNRLIGVAGEVELPELKMKTSTVSGAGIGGEIDSPTPGQWESMEMEIPFNIIYGGFLDLLGEGNVASLTLRAAQQTTTRLGGSVYKPLRVVVTGKVKAFKLGKLAGGDAMDSGVTLELTYLMVENGGKKAIEIDKLNDVYLVGGKDMLAAIHAMT